MKLKEYFYRCGIRPGVREYTYDLESFFLPTDGEVQYAHWRHPKESLRPITQEAVDALREFVREGDAAIDIGAHVGDTSVPLALAAGRTGAVFALEPNGYVFKVLLANAALNRTKTNIFPLNFAAMPEDGAFEFDYTDPGFCNGGNLDSIAAGKHTCFFKLQVVGKNVQTYLRREHAEYAKKIRYIKIDTEGFDRQVIESLRELLLECRPYVRSEVYLHLTKPQRVAQYQALRELGYTIYKFDDHCHSPGEKLVENDLMNWRHFDIFAIHQANA